MILGGKQDETPTPYTFVYPPLILSKNIGKISLASLTVLLAQLTLAMSATLAQAILLIWASH